MDLALTEKSWKFEISESTAFGQQAQVLCSTAVVHGDFYLHVPQTWKLLQLH